jgi:hypothetical protein
VINKAGHRSRYRVSGYRLHEIAAHTTVSTTPQKDEGAKREFVIAKSDPKADLAFLITSAH